MVPSLSFREFILQPKVKGPPQQLLEEILLPVFSAAKSAVFFSTGDLQQLQRLSWGASALLKNNCVTSIIVLSDEIKPAKLPLPSERIGIFKHLAAESRLKLRSMTPGTLTRESIFQSEETTNGLIFLTDAFENSVVIRPMVSEDDGSLAANHIHWSFGDPMKYVWNIGQLLTGKVAHPAKQLVHNWKTILEESPDLPEDWVETVTITPLVGIDEPIELFPHQRTAIDAWFGAGSQGVFKMCTGAGKTIASIQAAKEFLATCDGEDQAPAILISVPTRVLADQWTRELDRFGLTRVLKAYESAENWIGILESWIAVATSREPRVVVTTYRTLADPRFLDRLNRAQEKGGRVIWIADEMHNLASTRLLQVMKRMGTIAPIRLGLSATPEIEGNFSATEGMLNFFNQICASYELEDGIKDGVLCPYRYFPVPAYLNPDLGFRYFELLSQIEARSVNSKDLINLYRESRELIRTSGVQVTAFEGLLADLSGRKEKLKHTLIYCPPGYADRESSDEANSDEESRRLIHEVIVLLRAQGLSCASILGETPSGERDGILQRFSEGKTDVLCAIGCLDEGIDVPSIQRAIVLYSVDRLKQFIQRRGRILRVPRGITNKVAEIYDIVVLPHGSSLPPSQAQELLEKELRRYSEFAKLALNSSEAKGTIDKALEIASNQPA